MGVLSTNTTAYVHPNEPNLLNLHKAMEYAPDGRPHFRVTLGSDTITINGDVNLVDNVRVNNSTTNPVPVFLMNTTSTVYQGTNPWTVTGTVTGTVTVSNFTSTVSISNTVTISNTSFAVTNFPTTSTVYQGTNPWVVTGNVNVTTTQTDLVVANSTYFMNVARGLVNGQYLDFKNGYCPSMSASSDGYTVWNEGTVYPWASWTSAQRLFIQSTSASDTGQTILINGLDANYGKISETVTTNGTVGVTTTQSFLRINNVIIIAGTLNVGNIHTHLTNSSGALVGSMPPNIGRNKQAIYTVPAGYKAYIVYGNISSYKNGTGNVSGQVDMRVRPYGGVFLVAYAGIAANGQYSRDFTIPFEVTEKSDIDVRFSASGNGTTVACDWEMILIPM